MAARMSALVDAGTGKARDGTIEIVDENTVKLHLSKPDISLISSFSDYPAAITHASHDGDPTKNPMGTGPYRLEKLNVGIEFTIVRADNHKWWGGETYLDKIEYLDYGSDPASTIATVESEEIDVLYETMGEYIEVMYSLGWTLSKAVTASTMVARPNQLAEVNGVKPFADTGDALSSRTIHSTIYDALRFCMVC